MYSTYLVKPCCKASHKSQQQSDLDNLMAEMPLPVQYPISTFHLASLLNHDVWNINRLIIPAEMEIKDVFYFCFLTDGDLILNQQGTV